MIEVVVGTMAAAFVGMSVVIYWLMRENERLHRRIERVHRRMDLCDEAINLNKRLLPSNGRLLDLNDRVIQEAWPQRKVSPPS